MTHRNFNKGYYIISTMNTKPRYFKIFIISLCIFFLMFSNINVIKIVDSESNQEILPFSGDITIPDDYSSIQAGINNAESGDVIYVKSGSYKENILVDIDSLTIIGEDKSDTIIDGDKFLKKHTMEISSENVTIQGFTIKNGWNEEERLWDLSGIKINASNARIIGNIIRDNRLGLSVMTNTDNITIKNNTFINDGLMLANYVYNFEMSINDFRHNIENNTVNGKPLYYICDKSDYTVPEDAGQVMLVNCTNVTVKNLDLKDTDFSINLAGCFNCNISDNIIDDTDGELILFYSENNTIQGNKISNCLHGICLDYKKKNNVVRNNEIYDNWIGISSITGSENNKIYSNQIYKNKAGIEITTYYPPMKSKNHRIFQNQIYNNNKGILITGDSENLSISNNTINKNLIGIDIKESEGNIINNNSFFRNIFSALFFNCKKNIWENNYWNRPRLFPKMIYGYRNIGKVPIPWLNLDLNPSRKK